MATTNVLVVTVAGNQPVVVAADDPSLVGQVVIDYVTEHASTPEFQVNIKQGTLETA